jgi:hypothetical protein
LRPTIKPLEPTLPGISDATPLPQKRFVPVPDPLDEKIRRLQESIHEEDERPSQVTVVVEQRRKTSVPPASVTAKHKHLAGVIGKVTGAVIVIGSLAELVRQVVQLAGGK